MDLLATREPEAQPIVLLAQAKLNPRFEQSQNRSFVAAERFCDTDIRHAPKHSSAEVLQPRNHLSIARCVQRYNRPNPPCWTTQEKPAKVLHGFEVQACHRLQVIHQQ